MSTKHITVVGYATEDLRLRAEKIAQDLHFQLDKDACPCLFVESDKLSLKMPEFNTLAADFSPQKKDKHQGLIKACKPAPGMKILDATAGWGRDAALLASFGAEVMMCERHPLMAALLQDALSRASNLRLQLYQGEAKTLLQSLDPADYPEVVYIDPMHPTRTKSALVKKDLQALQQIIGEDRDALALLQCAMQHVKKRVVVKWPQKLPPLLPSSSSVEGKTVRFDIYY